MPKLFRYRVLIFEDENLPALISHDKLCARYCLGKPFGTQIVNESYIAEHPDGIFMRAENGYFCDFQAFKRVESAQKYQYLTATADRIEPVDFAVIDWRDKVLEGRSSSMGLNIAAHCLLTNPSVSIILTTAFSDELNKDTNIDAKWLYDRIITFRPSHSSDLSANCKEDKGTVWGTQFIFDQERDKAKRLLNRHPNVAAAVLCKLKDLPIKYNELKQYNGLGSSNRAKNDFVDFINEDLYSDEEYLYRLPHLFPFHTATILRAFNAAITASPRPDLPSWYETRKQMWNTCAELLSTPRSEIVFRFANRDFPYSADVQGTFIKVPGLHRNQGLLEEDVPLQLAVLQQEIPLRAAKLRAEFKDLVPSNDPVFTYAERLASNIATKAVTTFGQLEYIAQNEFRVRPIEILSKIAGASIHKDFSEISLPLEKYWFYGIADDVENAIKNMISAAPISRVSVNVGLPGDYLRALTMRFNVKPGPINLADLKGSMEGHVGQFAGALKDIVKYFTVFLGNENQLLCLDDLIEGVVDSTKDMALSVIEVSTPTYMERSK